jgi:hypothetical protein
MLSITLAVPEMRDHTLADLDKDWDRFGSFWAPLYMVGSTAASFGLMAIYGVVGGVLVMGVAGYLRPAHAPGSESNGDSAKMVD